MQEEEEEGIISGTAQFRALALVRSPASQQHRHRISSRFIIRQSALAYAISSARSLGNRILSGQVFAPCLGLPLSLTGQ